eukprot:1182358-Pyramimonas_sp.AAC.1
MGDGWPMYAQVCDRYDWHPMLAVMEGQLCPRFARAGKRAVHPRSFMRAGVLTYCAWRGEVEC